MSKFRSKPVEIEAVQLTPLQAIRYVFRVDKMPNGLDFNGIRNADGETWTGGLMCATRQGEVEAHVGDWIIQESDGSGCYPCKPDVFAAKYEPA